MRTILKKLIKSLLAYLILSYTLINYPPSLCNDPGFGLCNSGCNTKEHHNNSHQLTKWTDKEIKPLYQKDILFLLQKSQKLNLFWENQLSSSLNLFSLYSRPPPRLI